MRALSTLPPEWSPLYPFQPRYQTLACGWAMSYVDEGDGPPVVMVHGNPTWSFYYRSVIIRLRDRYRCLAPDHIGCGLSDKPGKSYPFTLEQRIRDLEEWIEALQIDQFDLIVHDWGGAIGIGMALRRIKKLRRLIILNTAAFADTQIPKRIALCRVPLLGKFLVQGCNGFAGPTTRMAVAKRPLPKRVRKGYLYPYRTWRERLAVFQFVKDIPMRSSHPSYTTLRGVESGLSQLKDIPVAILWGGKDFCFNDHFLARWKQILPQATALRYPEAGHFLLEDETDSCLDAIETFLAIEDNGIPDTVLR